MAHFAEIVDGIVQRVIVVHNNEVPNEETGKKFLASIGLLGEWIQTSFNNNPIEGQDRGKFAAIGDIWDGSKFSSPVSGDEE